MNGATTRTSPDAGCCPDHSHGSSPGADRYRLSGVVAWPLIALIRAYQVTLGVWLGGRCRFYPSCSHYAIQALRERGIAIGLWLTVRRLARCHPWGGHGVDLVPPRPLRRRH